MSWFVFPFICCPHYYYLARGLRAPLRMSLLFITLRCYFFFFSLSFSPSIPCLHSHSFHWICTFNTSYMTVSVNCECKVWVCERIQVDEIHFTFFLCSLSLCCCFFALRCHVWCSHFRFCLLFSRARDENASTTPVDVCLALPCCCHQKNIKKRKTSSECCKRRHSINCEYLLAYKFLFFLTFVALNLDTARRWKMIKCDVLHQIEIEHVLSVIHSNVVSRTQQKESRNLLNSSTEVAAPTTTRLIIIILICTAIISLLNWMRKRWCVAPDEMSEGMKTHRPKKRRME